MNQKNNLRNAILMTLVFAVAHSSDLRGLVGQDTATTNSTTSVPKNESTEKSTTVNKKDSDDDLEMKLGSKSFAMDKYGENGDTKSEASTHWKEIGKSDEEYKSSLGTTRVTSETRIGEARARTYSDKLDLENGDSSASIGAEAQANLVRSDVGVKNTSPSQTIGGVNVQHEQQASAGAFVGAHAQSGASVKLDSDPEVAARAGVFVGAKAEANASNTTTVLGASSTQSVEGYVAAGAGADAGVGLNKKGVSADAGAFAGAKAGADGSVEVAGVEGGGSAEAWAGVGARAKADAGYDAGKLRVSLGAGAALGVGGSVDTSVTVDVAKTAHDIKQIDRRTGRMIESGAGKAKNKFNSAGKKLDSTIQRSGRVIQSTRQRQTPSQWSSLIRTSSKSLNSLRNSNLTKPSKNPVYKSLKVKKPTIKKPTVKKPTIKKPTIKKPKIKKRKIKSPFKR